MRITVFGHRSDNGKNNDMSDLSDQELEKTTTKLEQCLGQIRPEEQPPVGFFHPALDKARAHVFLEWAKITLILCTAVLGILSIFWGSFYHVNRNMTALGVYIVDFDGKIAPYTDIKPIVGPTVVEVCERERLTNKITLGYEIRPASEFLDPIDVRQKVYNEHAWAAIIVNPNATALLFNAINTGNTSYEPNGALQLIYVQARQDNAVNNFLLPQLAKIQSEINVAFGKKWTEILMRNATGDGGADFAQKLAQVPQAINPAIGVSTFNLRPFGPPWATPSVSVGLLFLIILSFFSFSFYLPIHRSLVFGKGHPPLRYWQLIAWHYLALITAYFFISLAYSLLSLAFQIPFANRYASDIIVAANPNRYGRGSFVVYWMVNFLGITALGISTENVAMFVGMPWVALWLLFWVVTNVSTSFYEVTLMAGFYRWGYGWPLHNIVGASRTILFGTHSRLGLNIGVLIVWVTIGTILFPICDFVSRRRSIKLLKAEKAARDREHIERNAEEERCRLEEEERQRRKENEG